MEKYFNNKLELLQGKESNDLYFKQFFRIGKFSYF
jgi:hypothetical protein